MTRPTLTYILPDKVGGVFSYVQNLLCTALAASSRRTSFSRMASAMRTPARRANFRLYKVTIFEHDLPGRTFTQY